MNQNQHIGSTSLVSILTILNREMTINWWSPSNIKKLTILAQYQKNRQKWAKNIDL